MTIIQSCQVSLQSAMITPVTPSRPVRPSQLPSLTPYQEHLSVHAFVLSADKPDSPSSKASFSRLTTPSQEDLQPIPQHAHQQQNQQPETPIALAAKAVRILGLEPGTLPHARAALENARDEVRRTADTSAPFGNYVPYTTHSTAEYGGGLKGKIDRAEKAMSIMNGIPGVVVGYNGGKEEEMTRERRRRAVDGVLYWQKQVARLEALETPTPSRPNRR